MMCFRISGIVAILRVFRRGQLMLVRRICLGYSSGYLSQLGSYLWSGVEIGVVWSQYIGPYFSPLCDDPYLYCPFVHPEIVLSYYYFLWYLSNLSFLVLCSQMMGCYLGRTGFRPWQLAD